MILDYKNAEALSQLASDSGWKAVSQCSFRKATIAGIIELARCAFIGGADAVLAARTSLELAGQNVVSEYFNILAILRGDFSTTLPRDRLYASPEMECWLVKTRSCIESNEFLLFLQRFQRSMRNHGFGDKLSMSLCRALAEMAENVVRHSSRTASSEAFGVVAFHVNKETMNYVVADTGRGVLASLQENPRWAHLSRERDALLAVSRNGATRSVTNEFGDGFKQTIKSFIDYEGILALRSGDDSLRLSGKMDNPETIVETTAYLAGFRVAAFCSLKGSSEELQF